MNSAGRRFLEQLSESVLMGDGPMGSRLYELGVPLGGSFDEPPEDRQGFFGPHPFGDVSIDGHHPDGAPRGVTDQSRGDFGTKRAPIPAQPGVQIVSSEPLIE